MSPIEDLSTGNLTMADVMAVADQPELPALQGRLKKEHGIITSTARLQHALKKMYFFGLLDSTKPLSEMGDYARRVLAAMCSL